MDTEYLKLIFDVVILAGLGGFMYYAWRLSKALSNFRATRNEFDGIMHQLGLHIREAQTAVAQLREATKKGDSKLQKQIEQGRLIADELQLMNQASDNLASRLEVLASQGARTAKEYDQSESFDLDDDNIDDNIRDFLPKKSAQKAPKKAPKEEKGFMIQDREFDGFDDDDAHDSALDTLGSAAERELYKALKQTQK